MKSPTPDHPYGPSPLRVIAVNLDGVPLDCEDDDTAHVWIKVPGWTMRRAFLTGAAPFAAAAQCEPADLVGRIFLARLDLNSPPTNDDTAGERLEWPDLREAPPLRDEWTRPTEPAVMPHDRAAYDHMRDTNPNPGPCCQRSGPVPHWPMWNHCGGGNAPGRPIRPHCTCNSCF